MKKSKLPAPFGKPLSEKKLNKKVYRRIYLDSERRFLDSKLQRDEQGRYFIDPELSKEEQKHLRRLAKAIKKNRGLLSKWKLITLAILLIVVVGFSFFFKDKLFERSVENGLELLFEADVEMDGAEVSLIGGRLGFSHLSIADAKSPMRNLIELGRTRFDVDVWKLFSRKFVAEEIVCEELRFNTPRKSSGALSDASAQGAESTVEEIQSAGMEIAGESADKLIEKYRDALESPQVLESTQNRYEQTIARWEERTEEASDRIEDLETRVEELLRADLSTIDTAEEVKSYLDKVNTLQQSLDRTRRSLQSSYEDYRADTAFVSKAQNAVEQAIENDAAYLREAVSAFESDAGGILTEAAASVLRRRLGRIYTCAERALEVFHRLDERTEAVQRRFSDGGRDGTVVSFPVREYPSFLIKRFALSLGSAGSSRFSEFRINDLTGEQEIWGKPTTASISVPPAFSSELTIDTRKGADYAMQGTGILNDYPLEVSDGLSSLSIEDLRGKAGAEIGLSLNADFSGKGKADIVLSELKIDYSDTDSVVADAVSQVLEDMERIDLQVSFDISRGSMENIRVTSSIERELEQRIGAYAERQAGEAAAWVEEALYDYLSEELEKNNSLNGELQTQGKELLSDLRTADDLGVALNEQRAELRDRAEKEIEKQKDELLDQAQQKMKELGEELNF
ncbi:MAG: TIGR03545 family protein [Spirochaetales bacterium]|nr:TIGR03545 family protein [Spirochaetales bacterium]MCF7938241.1 TIGR03545 family protein [Spirochaetales bacterium]